MSRMDSGQTTNTIIKVKNPMAISVGKDFPSLTTKLCMRMAMEASKAAILSTLTAEERLRAQSKCNSSSSKYRSQDEHVSRGGRDSIRRPRVRLLQKRQRPFDNGWQGNGMSVG